MRIDRWVITKHAPGCVDVGLIAVNSPMVCELYTETMCRFARFGLKRLKNCRRPSALFAVAALWLPSAVSLAAGTAIDVNAALAHYRCYTCHSDRESLAGPAFADIAARYRSKKDAVSYLAREIDTGVRTGGPWHMPPHPEVRREEARAMATYIMSLGDKSAHPAGH